MTNLTWQCALHLWQLPSPNGEISSCLCIPISSRPHKHEKGDEKGIPAECLHIDMIIMSAYVTV